MASTFEQSFQFDFADKTIKNQILDHLLFMGPSSIPSMAKELGFTTNYLYRRLYLLVKDQIVQQFTQQRKSIYYVNTNPLLFDELGFPIVDTDSMTLYQKFIYWAIEQTNKKCAFGVYEFKRAFKRSESILYKYLKKAKTDGFILVAYQSHQIRRKRRYKLFTAQELE
jgi:hypothetical protein